MMTESPQQEETEASPSPTTHPGATPRQPRPTTGDMHTGPDNNALEEVPLPSTLAARDREVMPPPSLRPPKSRGSSAWRSYGRRTTSITAPPGTTW